MVFSLYIHLRSSLSRSIFASLESGGAGIKVAILIIIPLTREGDSGRNRLKCPATVVSLSWAMSKM